MPVKKLLAAVVLVTGLPAMAGQLYRQPDIDVVVPSTVFTDSQQQQAVSCNACCIYENKYYSEGAVVKTEGILLQCQRDEKVLSTHSLVWHRITP